MANVVRFRGEYNDAVETVFNEARGSHVADEKTSVIRFDLENPATPVLNVLNWPVHQDDDHCENVQGSTIQGPIHQYMEAIGLHFTFVERNAVNNGSKMEFIANGRQEGLKRNDEATENFLANHHLLQASLNTAMGLFPVICVHGKEAAMWVSMRLELVKDVTLAFSIFSLASSRQFIMFLAKDNMSGQIVMVFATVKFCYLFRGVGVHGLKRLLNSETDGLSPEMVRKFGPVIAYGLLLRPKSTSV